MTEDEIKQLDHNFSFLVKEIKKLHEDNKKLAEKVIKLENSVKRGSSTHDKTIRETNKKVSVIKDDLINIKSDIQNLKTITHVNRR